MNITRKSEYTDFLEELNNNDYCKTLKNETEFNINNHYFDKCNIVLSFLEYMPNLEKLVLIGCKLKKLEYISNLKHLKYLNLMDTNVKDLSFLKNSNSIVELNMFGSPARDFSPILNLNNLNHVYTVESKASLILFTHLKNLKRFNNYLLISNYWRRVSNTRT